MNSELFRPPFGWMAGVLLVAVLMALTLTRLPYRNHKQPFKPWQVAVLAAVPLACIALYPLGHMWNAGMVAVMLYLSAPWLSVPIAKRAAYED